MSLHRSRVANDSRFEVLRGLTPGSCACSPPTAGARPRTGPGPMGFAVRRGPWGNPGFAGVTTIARMPTSGSALLSPDLPLEDPADDRLGYVRFSRLIANAVASMVPLDGLVVGLHGPPGAGRTSVVNFVRRLLEDVPHTVVSEFNPWRYTAGEDIARRYLETLIPVLAPGVEAGDDPGGDAGRGRRGAAARAHAARRRHRRPRPCRALAGCRDRPARIGRHRPAERRPPARARADDAGGDRPRAGRAGAVRPAAPGGAPADALRRPACADGREPARLWGVRRALGHDLLARHREPDRDAPGRDPAHERAAAHLPAGLPRAEPRRLHRRRGGAGLPARPLRHDPPSPRVLCRRLLARPVAAAGSAAAASREFHDSWSAALPDHLRGCGPDPACCVFWRCPTSPGASCSARRRERERARSCSGEPGAVRRLLPVRRPGRRPSRTSRWMPTCRTSTTGARSPRSSCAWRPSETAPAPRGSPRSSSAWCGGADARRRARGQRRRRSPARGRR